MQLIKLYRYKSKAYYPTSLSWINPRFLFNYREFSVCALNGEFRMTMFDKRPRITESAEEYFINYDYEPITKEHMRYVTLEEE